MEFEDTVVAAIDKLRDASENGKVPRKLRDLLEDDLTAEEFQDRADSLRTKAEELQEQAAELESKAGEIEQVSDALAVLSETASEVLEHAEEWEAAEGRDEKAEARASLLDTLSRLVDAFDEADGLDVPEGVDGDEPVDEWQQTIDRRAHAVCAQLIRAGLAPFLATVEDDNERKALEAAQDYEWKAHEMKSESVPED
jgi:hypothetical protein